MAIFSRSSSRTDASTDNKPVTTDGGSDPVNVILESNRSNVNIDIQQYDVTPDAIRQSLDGADYIIETGLRGSLEIVESGNRLAEELGQSALDNTRQANNNLAIANDNATAVALRSMDNTEFLTISNNQFALDSITANADLSRDAIDTISRETDYNREFALNLSRDFMGWTGQIAGLQLANTELLLDSTQRTARDTSENLFASTKNLVEKIADSKGANDSQMARTFAILGGVGVLGVVLAVWASN